MNDGMSVLGKADIAAQLRVYEFAPCCRSVQHDVVKYYFLIAYLA
jgi:hypothetical protein